MQSLIRSITSQFRTSFIYRSFQSSPRICTDLIQRYAHDRALNQGKIIHAHLIVNGLANSTHFASNLISFYTLTNHLCNARKLFDEIPESNIARWILLIGAYSRCGFYQEALTVFHEMQNHGLRLNKFVVPSVLRACAHLYDLRIGKILHSLILRYSFQSDIVVVTALIDMYCRCGDVENGRRVFDTMEQFDLGALNAMVLGYAQHGFAKEGFHLVDQMQMFNIKPNLVTWNTLISGFAKAGDQVMVSKLFQIMFINGVEPDVVSWTSVISGYVHNFHNQAAFHAFKQMLEYGFYPNSATITSLLPACASITNARIGRALHGYTLVIGIEEDIHARSALVDMYAKSGFISEAKMMFSKMTVRNTVTWNSMIFGYANHGYCNEAIELFNHMEKLEGEKLDYLSFMAVLTACSHAGIVQMGKSLFLLMQEKYKIVPRLEHYACMVDLLGRAGNLSEAYDIIKTMPMKPDRFAWGALLGACRIHGDIELAEIAARNLAELEPGNAGNNMLLSNLYAHTGSWEIVARYKSKIKRHKLRKLSGCSWIETT
ncbi:pentatricopeptide repeat-containing protein At5g59600-like [Euphorbia lathyris]|uniref:pentatricopeptide repeat-containing protein At5g59600-like n=1 Tax=Euphorbia lathyris TaxID=212925 RepID=UPI0033133537